ncbi:MAG: hypothetical protein AAGC73_10555 [Verrucomicrobiota bacterium]
MSALLSKFLEGHQQKSFYYDELEALIKALPKLRKTDTVIYDLQMDTELSAFDAIHFAARKTNLVALEPFREGASEQDFHCPENADYYLLLSSDERKARTRLEKVLHEVAQKHAKAQAARKRAKHKSRKRTQAPIPLPAEPTSASSSEPPVTLTRYLRVKSAAMQHFAAQLSQITEKASCILIHGEDGAEFELVARELNFRANGDNSPLLVVDPMGVCLDQVTSTIDSNDRIAYCYLGLSYELSILTIERLNAFLESLEATPDQAPKICLILGHVDDSETYLDTEEVKFIERFRKISQKLSIPAFADRKEDISLIAQSIFTTMRVAHPFLITRTMTAGAIQYLESKHEELDYSGLVRVIRNAMALTERDTLTHEELKSFSDDSPTSQHLVESLADEKYFKGQVGAA